MNPLIPPLLTYRYRRGFTIVEMLVATGISALVMVAVASMEYYSARSIKEVFGQARTRTTRLTALDLVRYRLMNARIGSCTVSQSSHRIDYVDPTLGGVSSTFYFTPTQKTLYYDADINSGESAKAIATGVEDLTFQVTSNNIVQLSATSKSDMAYGKQDLQGGQTKVYLRNN